MNKKPKYEPGAREVESRHDSELEDVSDTSENCECLCLLNSDSDDEKVARGRQPEWVPAWLFTAWFGIPTEVKERMESKRCEEKKHKLTMFDVSGPALRWLWFCTAISWTYSMCLPWFAYNLIPCTSFGQFRYPLWLWWTFLPVLMTLAIVEWRCLMYTIVPVAQWLEELSVPLVGKAPFGLWLAFTGVQSLTSHADVMTQGLLLASTWRSFSCPGWDQISVAWESVWDSSQVSWISAGRDLKLIMLLSWGVLIVQLPLHVLTALPCRCVDFRMGINRKYESSDCEDQGEPYGYTTWIGTTIWHADALTKLAFANRMGALRDPQFELSMQRAKDEVSRNANRGLQVMGMAGRLVFLQAVLINLCQNCTKLELQTTLFALAHMIEPDVDYQVVLALLLANASSLMSLLTLVRKVCELRIEMSSAWEQVCDLERPLPALYEYIVASLYHYLTVAAIAICVFVQIHCIAKFAMAFVCHDAVWNLPNNCVDVQLSDKS